MAAPLRYLVDDSLFSREHEREHTARREMREIRGMRESVHRNEERESVHRNEERERRIARAVEQIEGQVRALWAILEETTREGTPDGPSHPQHP